MEFAAAALLALAPEAAAGGAEAAGVAGAAALDPTIAGAASAGAASSGGGFLSSIFSASGVASILSGTATAASVLNAQRAGEINAQGLELKAGDSDIAIGNQVTEGMQQRQSLRAGLLKAVSERDVAQAAGGGDISFGTPAQARYQATKDEETALSVSEGTTRENQQRLLERSASLRQMAANARAGGLANGAVLALSGAADLARRYPMKGA